MEHFGGRGVDVVGTPAGDLHTPPFLVLALYKGAKGHVKSSGRLCFRAFWTLQYK